MKESFVKMRSCNRSGVRYKWVLGLALLPVLGWAQTSTVDADKAWRQANELVGQFRRGHADLLKWEQTQAKSPNQVTTASPVNALDLSTPEAAVELAWKAHPSVVKALYRLGASNRALLLAGKWTELDPSLSWKLEELDEALDLAISVRKAWLQATASQLALEPIKVSLDAAQVAQELGQRMVAVGNWSKLAQARHQLAWANAQLNWQRAQYAAAQDQARLLKLLQLSGQFDAVRFPNAMPTVPEQAMSEPEFNKRLQTVQAQVNTLRRDRHRGAAQLAYRAYLGSHAVAKINQNEVLKLRDFVTEETQLHYSGMLKSTWELLTEVQNQAQARADVINAQRDFALAEIDLQSSLFGGEPEGLASLGGASADTASKGH
jgi:outer membrane protein TolC